MKRKPNQPRPSKWASTSVDRGLPDTAVAPTWAAANPRHLSMSRQHSLHLLKFLDEDRTRQRFCDVSVSVGGNLYTAHKVVLAHGSSYFHAELSKNPSAAHVTLDHVDESVFRHLLGFLYTAECVVAEAELPALVDAARFLDMMEVLKLLRAEGEEGDAGRPQTSDASGAPELEDTGRPEAAVVLQEDPPPPPPPPPPVTACCLCGRRLSSTRSLQNHMVRSHGVRRRREEEEEEEEQQQQPGPKEGPAETETTIAAGARRSVRSRRTPAKYKRDDVAAYPLAEPKEKPATSPPREEEEEDEEEEERRGDAVTKKPDLKLDSSATSRLFEADAEEEEGGREAVDEEAGGDGSPKRSKRQRQSSSDADAGRRRGLQQKEGEVPGPPGASPSPSASGSAPVAAVAVAVKGGPQAPVYPEGLAPIVLQMANKKILKCPRCDKTFDRAGELGVGA